MPCRHKAGTSELGLGAAFECSDYDTPSLEAESFTPGPFAKCTQRVKSFRSPAPYVPVRVMARAAYEGSL